MRFVYLKILVSMLLALSASSLVAQDDTKSAPAPQKEAQPYVQQYDEADVEEYEFGLNIKCSGGYAKNIVVNAPIPIAWPEQEIEPYEETRSNNVTRLRVKKLGKTASIMSFVVPRMNNGDYAEAILRYRVRRSNTIAPDDTNQFEFAKKLTGKLKAYLKPSPYIESREKRIREIGKKVFEDNKDEPAWDQIEAVYSWIRENIEYKFDTQIHTCVEALDNGHGDCEELSSLFIAICRSQGVPARAVWVPGHTYPEFYLEDETGKGHWFPCQIAGASHEFGEMRESRPILQKGDRFKINGQTKRYVEAGLRSSDATGSLKIDHIMRKVANE